VRAVKCHMQHQSKTEDWCSTGLPLQFGKSEYHKMADRFIQKRISLHDEVSTGKLKVSKLFELLNDHPYREEVWKQYQLDQIKDDVIVIDHIDVIYKRIKFLNEHFRRFSVFAYNKDISIAESKTYIEDVGEKSLIFNLSEYVEIDEVKGNLDCIAIYDSKNTFFDEYDMAKFANRLYKDNLGELADYNINYFKDLAETNKKFKKYRSYRLVQNKEELFLRGITSVDRYFEYGIDFTFVVSMLSFHKDMIANEGNAYVISSAAISESKLEIIVADKNLKDAGEFGKVSSAMVITTNDLGQGSLNYSKVIKVGGSLFNGVYIFPPSDEVQKTKLVLSHSSTPLTVLAKLKEFNALLNNTDEFIKDLQEVKKIKSAEELRQRILLKLSNPRSAFKDAHQLRDIFRLAIANEIESFAKLLDMCGKAEELDIDYDLKEKLRVIISDILLSTRK
jgi:hypothetical protein